MTRAEMENRILDALSTRLTDPDLMAFAEEDIAERSRLAANHVDDRAIKEKERAKVIREQDLLVNAILAGTPSDRIRDRMAKLEAEIALAAKGGPSPTLLPPRIAETYHVQVSKVIAALQDADHESEARDTIRGLIDKIVAMSVPTSGKRSRLELRLHADLAGILALSLGADLLSGHQKTSCEQEVIQAQGFLVAGAGFEPATFRL